jgi:hypothetical protein
MPGQPLITVEPTSSIEFLTTVLNDKKRAATLLGKSEDLGYFQGLKNRFSRKPDGILKEMPDSFGKMVKTDSLIGEAKGITNVQDFYAVHTNLPQPMLKDIFTKVQKSKMSARELNSAIKELNAKVDNFNDPIATGNKASLKKLVTLMSEDLDSAIVTQRPELADAINKANTFYSQGVSKLNSAFGENIKKFGDLGQYDKIIPSIISNSVSVEDIPRIFEVIGTENVPHLQAAYLEELFRKARRNGNFTPQGLTSQIKSFGGEEKLAALLSPEQLKAVKNIETISQGLGKAEKIASGSQTAFLVRIVSEIATFSHNPIGAAKLLLGDALFSKFVSSRVGQEILAEGLLLTGKTGRNIQAIGKKTGAIPSVVSKGGGIMEETK